MKTKLLLLLVIVALLVSCGQAKKDLESKLEDAKDKAGKTLKEAEKEIKDVEKEVGELKEVVKKEVTDSEKTIELTQEKAYEIAVKIYYMTMKYEDNPKKIDEEIEKLFEKYDFNMEQFNTWGENWEEKEPENANKFKLKAKKEAEGLIKKEK